VRQVHGADVVVVERHGQHAGAEADAAVTAVPGCVLAVQVADCAPVALVASSVVGVVHAGWRGLLAGVVPNAVAAMRSIGAGEIDAVVGPCIDVACYEFGPEDLDAVAAALGDGVRGLTGSGSKALNLRAAVRASLRTAGVHQITDTDVCTACSPAHWSHRARRDHERQAVVAWM
jgi:polyphenol oxidase